MQIWLYKKKKVARKTGTNYLKRYLHKLLFTLDSKVCPLRDGMWNENVFHRFFFWIFSCGIYNFFLFLLLLKNWTSFIKWCAISFDLPRTNMFCLFQHIAYTFSLFSYFFLPKYFVFFTRLFCSVSLAMLLLFYFLHFIHPKTNSKFRKYSGEPHRYMVLTWIISFFSLKLMKWIPNANTVNSWHSSLL